VITRFVRRSSLLLMLPMLTAGGVQLRAQGGSAGEPVTYSKDVAPIVFARCAACHHPDGPAPFSVLSYAAIRQHARQIAAVTASRYMPPAKAEHGYGEFVGQQRLTDAEIQMLTRWVDGGAPEGDPRDLPAAPTIARGWQLGTPDLVVPLPSYDLPASGSDTFRIFVVPIPAASTRFVRGFEFHPGATSIVHHANIRIDRTPASRRLDEEDPRPGYDGLLSHSATYPDGHFLAWTPGQAAPLLPKGLAWRLDPNTDLVVELHLQPTGKAETIQPEIGLYFTNDPPAQIPGMLRLGRQNIDIAPGQKNYIVTDSFTLPVPVDVLAVQPHAHYRAREVSGTATLPDGSVKPLILIRDWDFRWQQVYRYVHPLSLPAGTTLSMRYVYDNSADNPRNVTQPPQRVIWGQRSADEMGDLWIQVLTRTDRDLDRLLAALHPKVVAEDIVGYQARISAEPDSAPLHDDVALLYLDQGNVRQAVEHFERSVQLRPGSARAQFNLGTALAFGGALDAAIDHYRRALALEPDYALAHNNLGGLLLQRGDVANARLHLERALALDPANADVQFNAGRLYRQTGDGRACASFERALAARPGWEAARSELASCR
jgi:hypothetical protein